MMRSITGKYTGTGVDFYLDYQNVASFEVRRKNAESPGIVVKWDIDPGGEHWLHNNEGITLHETGL